MVTQKYICKKFWRWVNCLSIAFFSLNSLSITSQLKTFERLYFQQGYDDFQIDHYGYIYQINSDNLIKRNNKGEELYSYSNKLLGDISQLDVSNPLRPLLFYSDQGVIAVLDNTLSQQKHIISLNEIGLYQAKCIANSNFDNGIWLFDIDVNEIVKINNHSEITYRSGNLSVILEKMSGPVLRLIEKNKRLYAITKNEIFIIDQFGALLKTIPISASKGLIIKENNLLCYDGLFLKLYEILNFKTDTIKKSDKFFKITGYSDQIMGLSKNRKDLFFMRFLR